jgi:hypothetical protein
MDKNNLPTINLKGKQYVMVHDRLVFFNETFLNGSIITDIHYKDDGSYAWVTATVRPDVVNVERKFIAHSSGPVDEEKALEKLETVAVGRALAYMGIGIIESIASADEMKIWIDSKKPKIQKKESMAKIDNLESPPLPTPPF